MLWSPSHSYLITWSVIHIYLTWCDQLLIDSVRLCRQLWATLLPHYLLLPNWPDMTKSLVAVFGFVDNFEPFNCLTSYSYPVELMRPGPWWQCTVLQTSWSHSIVSLETLTQLTWFDWAPWMLPVAWCSPIQQKNIEYK